MIVVVALLLSLLTQAIVAQDTSLAKVKEAFDVVNIPKDIALPFDPSFLLEVSLPQTTGSAIVLRAGVQLPRNATVGPPSFTLVGHDIGHGPFVVATVDPDAPTPQNPNISEVRHFLGGNFVSERLFAGQATLTNTTAAVSDWLQPTPPTGSDAHRYIFLVFRQPQGFNDQVLVDATTPRTLFNISEFGAAVGLRNPIAGTFMLVAPDPA
ncbi:PEBP-like protein [Guyanagaster necrorhizus]|uniref:PEBP-like protein n=1 Tax=Guyanagaster necrorhizus TaxID=856835 RepID=A0A9P7VPC9_9AGAR|nr:PEBP-like protein [Guyanagaster necrorhizus MCA 3950]KAG7444233.1 PEBP-like protein [Guyanagaster necrorhizus MCA 3950]